VALSPTLTSLDVDDTLYPVANDENTIETNIAAPNSEPSVAKSHITVQQEIDSSVTSESPASAPVQLTSTSANIKDRLSLFRNSDNNEQLVTSESQSAMAANVSDISENVTSLQGDSNVENTTSESKESHPILALPEIGEAPLTTKSPEIGKVSVPAISPEIAETLSIFRKIIDNEQTVESELLFAVTNPEISTFVDNSNNPISPQDDVSTPTEVEQNTTKENLPAHKGYATGGHVTDSHVENRQQIAHSDTVPAMLTPGEFVINTRDAQKNLPLLHHINTGGTPHDIILPSLQPPNPTEAEEKTSSETPTKVDSFSDTSLQLKSAETHSPEISNSLIPSSLGLNIGKQKLSILNSPQLNTLQNETINVGEPSPQYSSPPMIFRKANPTSNTSSQWLNTPSEWSSVEELLNGNNDEFTSFNFDSVESNRQNPEVSHISESPQISAKHVLSFRGFADGGEVTPPDISREIEPMTETIESASLSAEGGNKDDTADLEALAREIYNRLRQRVEIERERHGGFSGRLPW
ncbi:hypothetical protein, partial [Nostoc sp. WHI]|uniref:hypothetical protein n=1 Tax=Nostoc sp. WHI TaxID=2650611 RepID=UPI0018C79776